MELVSFSEQLTLYYTHLFTFLKKSDLIFLFEHVFKSGATIGASGGEDAPPPFFIFFVFS